MLQADDSYIMIMKNSGAIIPVSENAFNICQYNKKSVDEEYRGAQLYSRRGDVRSIENISIAGLWGDSFLRKAVSFLSSAHKIDVTFSASNAVDLQQFKALVATHISKDAAKPDPSFLHDDPIDVVISRINNAATHSAVFDAISFPPTTECLDVL